MLEARFAVRRLEEYRPPLAERSGLRLDFNENSAGCSPRVCARLASLTPDDLSRYPERGLPEAGLAAFLGLTANQVLLTNGVDEAIHLLCQTYLDAGDEALVITPSYTMYRIYAAASGARVVSVGAQDFRFPLQAILDSLTEKTRLILLANPNNPTGALASENDLMELLRRAQEAAVLIDEAYYEFSGKTVMHQVGRQANLFVARTFSKVYGMAGLRVGALAGPAEQLQMVRRVASPYNVNQAALHCLPEALADQAYVKWYVEEVKQSRKQLECELRAQGVHFWPSHANFVLARIGLSKDAFLQAMQQRGILLRDRSSDTGCEGCVRITVGTREQTAYLLESLRMVWRDIHATQEIPA